MGERFEPWLYKPIGEMTERDYLRFCERMVMAYGCNRILIPIQAERRRAVAEIDHVADAAADSESDSEAHEGHEGG